MILHTVNKSPFAASSLDTCLRFATASDAVVLIEDGVYAAAMSTASGLDNTAVPVYALLPDVKARGLSGKLREAVTTIGYDEFVTLCTRYAVIKNWS